YLADMLRRHRIEVYQLAEKFSAEGKNFKPGHAFIVPVRQDQYRLIKAIFERTLKYSDSLFYDITTWTMPLAFGLDDVKISAKTYTANLLGAAFTGKEVPVIKTVNKSNYAYLLDWRDYFAPAALFEIQNAGLLVKAATKPFSLSQNGNDISYAGGTILVQVQGQKLIPDSIRSLLQRLVIKYGVHILGVNTGLSTGGTDLGSSSFKVVSQPEVALITGAGVNPTDAGEVWFLLDQRFNMPPVLLEASAFNRGNASDFNTIIMVGGNYDAIDKEKLKAWVRDGGTLILTEEAVSWASKNGISNVKLRTVKSPYDSIKNGIYNEREQVDGAQQMNGVILGTMADMSHPLSFGYSTPVVSLFKANRVYMEKSANPFASPFKYLDKPLQSGWLSRENSAAVKNSAAVVINVLGNGRIINIADNPNFRAFWMGGTRLMMNAVFFGRLIDGASARETE
ncbi:MAG: zinc carboxypeptidase, partial [Ferruginibacter sp.]